MTNTDEPIERVSHPEGPSLFFRSDPTFRFDCTVPPRHIIRCVDFIKSHQLKQPETAPCAHPASLVIGAHEIVDE